MNDTTKIAAEARKAIALALCIDLSPEGEAEIDAIIQAAIEKAFRCASTEYRVKLINAKHDAAHASEHRAGNWPYCDCEICKPLAAHASEEFLDCIEDARAIILRCVSVMTEEQVGQIAGIRSWLEQAPYDRAAHANESLIDAIVGDLVRETNIFPNQVERAKQILRKRLSVKKKVMNAGLKKVKK